MESESDIEEDLDKAYQQKTQTESLEYSDYQQPVGLGSGLDGRELEFSSSDSQRIKVKMRHLPTTNIKTQFTLGTVVSSSGKVSHLQTSSVTSVQCCYCERSRRIGIALALSATLIIIAILVRLYAFP